MPATIYVRAPCRLHFGMFSFGHSEGPQFGGVGVMVAPPAVEVTIASAERFRVTGALASRAERFARAAIEHWQLGTLPPCHIEVSSPPDHTGLGVGTQLGLSIAASLRRFLRLPQVAIEELASSVGRGARSAVGTYGFQLGGLTVDAGKERGQPLGKLIRRRALPDAWRFVLIRPAIGRGLAGEHEATAFARLPPVPEPVTDELWQITNEEILPAVERADCAAFGEAVYRFGRLAGECFAAVQGGPFARTETARLVESIREHGVPGVGQSSWGPTVFAVTADDGEARSLVAWLREQATVRACDIVVAHPNNSGASVVGTLRVR